MLRLAGERVGKKRITDWAMENLISVPVIMLLCRI